MASLLVTEQRKKHVRVAGEVCRPGGLEELQARGRQIGVDFFPSDAGQKPLAIALAALDYAKKHYHDVLLVDTAGRLAIDEPMMREIADLHAALKPVETLFVVDAMQGQDSVKVAKAFGDALPLTGIVLTKVDGDGGGGPALSVRQVTGKPIKFAGVSEKPDGLEPFHPERMASRILGMGDVLSLVEEARKTVDVEDAKKFSEKARKGKGFDLEDFKQQIGQMRKMGGISSMIDKLPAQLAQAAQSSQMEEKQLRRAEEWTCLLSLPWKDQVSARKITPFSVSVIHHGCDSSFARRRQETALFQRGGRRFAQGRRQALHRARRVLRSEGARRKGVAAFRDRPSDVLAARGSAWWPARGAPPPSPPGTAR